MTDEEKSVDEEIQSHLKKVYGFSEDQLLKEVEEAEKSVNDLDFSGAEDRIYKRMMERRAEKEKKEETGKKYEPDELFETVMPDGPVVSIVADKPDAEDTDKEKSPVRKAVRFKKKTFLLVAAVAAVLALMVGSTAIGEKNFFLRAVGDDVNSVVVVDNDANKCDVSKIENAYAEVSNTLDIIPILKFLYFPREMQFEQLIFEENKAILVFEYNGNSIYYILKHKDSGSSIGIKSDVQMEYSVYNDWISQDIAIRENALNGGKTEYEAQVYIENTIYCITGIMEKEEFDKMIENLCFQ